VRKIGVPAQVKFPSGDVPGTVDLIGFPLKHKGSRAAHKRCSVWQAPLELTRFVGRGTLDEAHGRVLTTAPQSQLGGLGDSLVS
jgi:hypothetical protein